jgi:hypothetical protein
MAGCRACRRLEALACSGRRALDLAALDLAALDRADLGRAALGRVALGRADLGRTALPGWGVRYAGGRRGWGMCHQNPS